MEIQFTDEGGNFRHFKNLDYHEILYTFSKKEIDEFDEFWEVVYPSNHCLRCRFAKTRKFFMRPRPYKKGGIVEK